MEGPAHARDHARDHNHVPRHAVYGCQAMSQSVAAICMVCGRRRTIHPYRPPTDTVNKIASRRCATCRTATEHFWINHPWENRLEEARVRLEQAERRLAESRAQLEDMGIRITDVGGCLSRKISVIRHLDDGTFVIQLGTDWPAPHALIGLKRATPPFGVRSTGAVLRRCPRNRRRRLQPRAPHHRPSTRTTSRRRD